MSLTATEVESFARSTGEVLRQMLSPLTDRIGELEKRLDGVTFERGEPGLTGPPGNNGVNGKDADEQKILGALTLEFEERFDAFVKSVELPKDGAPGQNGKDAEVHTSVVMAAVVDYLDAHPIAVPKDGRDGREGKDGRDGKDGKDATSITDEQIESAVDSYLLLHPPAAGKDGNPGRDGVDGAPGTNGKDGKDAIQITVDEVISAWTPELEARFGAALSKAMDAIPKPRDGLPGTMGPPGRDGRDATEIQVLDTIVEGRMYPRGTWAAFDGGLFRYTGAEWINVVDGVKEIVAEQLEDGRTVKITTHYASGKASVATYKLAAIIDRGVWSEKSYDAGDTVTWDGSMWIAKRVTKPDDKPGGSAAWRLSVKRGRNGKSETRKD